MKEVDYVVLPSMISPEKRIYAGIISKDKQGRGIWKTRCDVTGMVNTAFVEHFVARTKEENKTGKGMAFSFNDVKGYDVTVKVRKINKKLVNKK